MAMRKEWKASMVSEATWIETIPAHTVYGAMMSASKDYSLYVAKRKKGHVASSYLVNKFDVIICPTSNFTSAVKKLKRKIRSKTVRSLMNFAFARFRDRLKSKCELLGKTFMEVCESYTSKTHNITGEVIQNLGGRKTITSQGITLDRDINGSLGIFLKGLVAHPAKAAFVN